MKTISLILLTVFATATTITAAASQPKEIEITADQYACANSHFDMDISVAIDQETFQFRPSCASYFSEEFVTSDGTACRIDAGMCSYFSPNSDKIVVRCEGSHTESTNVACP